MKNKKINFKSLIISILIPLIFGGIGYLLGGSTDIYSVIDKPVFVPPPFIFPIVWTILYILMGISFYIVNNSISKEKNDAILSYFIQLIVNMLWTLFFFRLHLYLFSFVWIILLIILVITMIIKFYKIKPLSAYLQIPYLIWISFASILTFYIYLLN